LASFIDVFKNDKGFRGIILQDGIMAVSAVYYRFINPTVVVCPNTDGPLDGFTQGVNSIYFIMVFNPSISTAGWTATLYSGGQVKTYTQFEPGLNIIYGDVAVLLGAQKVVLTDPGGHVAWSATGGMYVSANCPTLVYASNYQLLPLVERDGALACRARTPRL
jgi:hypothetical protein